MATIVPKLTIKLGLDTAGLSKGAKQVKSTFMGMAKEAGTAEKHVNGLKKSLGGIWRITGGILLFNIIRKITHSIRDLIGATLDFETQMYNINSVAQLGTEEFKKLQDQVLDLALDPRIKDGPAELAAGLYEIVSAGYSTADAMKIMEQAALASTAGMTTSAVAADVLISTLGAYNLTADKSAEVTNELFQIVNISKYTFEDLANSLDSVTPTASALGVSLQEVGAGMATMASRGVDAETATVQLNAIMSALLKPTGDMTELINSLGYESGAAMIKTLGFAGTMKTLYGAIGDNEDLAAAVFGDVRALRGYFNLTNDGTVALTKNLELMGHAQDGAGAMTKALNEQMKASSFQIAVLQKNIKILAILGFGLLAPYLNKALVGINTFIAGFIKGFRHFREKGYTHLEAIRAGLKKILLDMFGPDVTKKVLHFFDMFVGWLHTLEDVINAVWPVLKQFLGFIVDHMDTIGPAILGAVVAVKLFGAALAAVNIILGITAILTSPLTLAMLAVAAIGALVAVAWVKNWGDIQGKTKAAIDYLVPRFKHLWEIIHPVVDAIIALGTYWKDIMTHKIEPGNLKNIPGWLQPIAIITGRVVKTLRVFFKVWQDKGFWAAMKILPTQIRAFGRALAGILKGMGLTHFAKAVKETFYDLARLFKDMVTLVDDLIHGRWSKVWGDLKDIAVDLLWLMIDRVKLGFALLVDIFNMIPWGTIGEALWNGFKSALQWLWDNAPPTALTIGVDILIALYNGLLSVWDNTIAPWLGGFKDLVAGYFSGAVDWLFQTGNDIIGGLADGITWAWNWMMGWLSKFSDWIINSWGQPLYTLWQVGANLIMGLWNGIVWAWNWLMDQVTALWDNLPGWARKIWDVASPSKVFEDIGANLSLGLAQGILGQIPAVEKAMDQLPGANASFSTGAPNGSRAAGMAMAGSNVATMGNVTVIVNLNGSGNTEDDANRIGDVVVARVLTAIDRMESVAS